MTRWHYAVGLDQKGPVGEEEFRALIADGTVGDKTRLWKKGMDSWRSADEIRELDTVFGRPPAPPTPPATALQATTVADGALQGVEASLRLAGPWSRFLARSIDTMVLIMPLGFAIGYAKGLWALNFRLGPPAVHNLLMSILLAPIIALLLALTMTAIGTTIGKTILGVKVPVPHGKNRLGFYVGREFKVLLAGVGLGIPIVALFTQIRQYRRVAAGKPASYDENLATVIGMPSKLRVFLGVIVVVGLFGFAVYLEMTKQEAAAELSATQLWTNPINNRTAYIAKTWKSKEMELDSGRTFMFESETQRATIVFGSQRYSFDGAKNLDYADTIQTAISDGVAITSEWTPVTIQGHPGLRATGKSTKFADVHVEATVVVIGRNAWRALIFANGQPASHEPNWDKLVDAAFSTAN